MEFFEFEFEFEFEFGMKMKMKNVEFIDPTQQGIPDPRPKSKFKFQTADSRQQTAETEMGSIEKTAESSKGAL